MDDTRSRCVSLYAIDTKLKQTTASKTSHSTVPTAVKLSLTRQQSLHSWLKSNAGIVLGERGVAHLVVHKTAGSTSYETIPPVPVETSGGMLSIVDMVVQRRDGPRRLCDNDDDCTRVLILHWKLPQWKMKQVVDGHNYRRSYYTVSQKKQDTKLLPITFPKVNRFSKFFHWQTHW